jgi:hypothetical protein
MLVYGTDLAFESGASRNYPLPMWIPPLVPFSGGIMLSWRDEYNLGLRR